MGLLAVLVIWLLPLAVLVAVAVWAVNLSASVFAIQRTLERMEARQSAAALAPAPAPAAPGPARAGGRTKAAPIDIEPFVD